MTRATARETAYESELFRLEVHPERDTVRIAPVGELDMVGSEQLDQRLNELYDAGFRNLVIDLRRVTFIDSQGLALIILWDAHARQNGLQLSLIQGPPVVQRIFELTGVLDRLPFR
ncbi:MAG TPA: STAS domain-containing protein [Solirubrobacteraceae bacterium]|nr:STAS domain-containing protein [Solirubrobacteraceae bacterium]